MFFLHKSHLTFLSNKPFELFILLILFIAMQFQKVSLTEPYDIAIALKYVEKQTLSEELKYGISKTHFKPDGDFTVPKSYLHGCNPSCSLNYLNNLFVYSTSSDSVFYIHCALVVSQEKRKNLNKFVNVGCND